MAAEIKGEEGKKKQSPISHFICNNRPFKKVVAAPKGLVAE